MISTKTLAQSPAGMRAGLATRITGIVFWGLIIVGLVLAFIISKGIEQELLDEYGSETRHLAMHLNELIAAQASPGQVQLQGLLDGLSEEDLPILGFVLTLPDRIYQAGKTSPDMLAMTREVLVQPADARHAVNASLSVYFVPVSEVISGKRKLLLVTLGGLFMLFGFILQWILQRVLTRPFMQMVETAQSISSGHSEHRFDEGRNDEFGFLAGFINLSLDSLVQQRNELSGAVERIRQSEHALHHEKERAEVTLHSIGDAVITSDAAGCVEYMNPVAESLTGWVLGEVKGRPIADVIRLIDESSHDVIDGLVQVCLEQGEVQEIEQHVLLVHKEGRMIPVSSSVAPIRDHQGDVVGSIMVMQDITPTRKLARELAYQASHDALTGLYNRTEFEARLRAALSMAQSEETEHALCYIDLDQFKVVNDTCGHVAGDELLRQLALLLGRQMRDNDVVARLGGDELGVLLMHSDLEVAQAVAERLRQTVNEFRFVWESHTFEIGASIGLVAVTHDSQSVSELMSSADVACYAAKDLGRNRVHVYQPDDLDLAQRRGEMQWVSRIQKALEDERFCLFYQPIVPVDGDGHAQPHYEALIRLRDENGELVPPMAFIPAAERYNLMPAIDAWVVKTALVYMQESHLKCGDYTCAINLSGQSLGDDKLLNNIIEMIEASDISPTQLIFEITETAAIANFSQAEHFINTMKKRGIRFSLDDFGSGLSSFAYLKNLNVDYLKIDGAFVRDMVIDPIDRAMVEAISSIGRVMGIKTIAEFVENQETLDELKVIGVDFAQGYFVAKPRSMDECQEFFGGCCPMEGADKASAG